MMSCSPTCTCPISSSCERGQNRPHEFAQDDVIAYNTGPCNIDSRAGAALKLLQEWECQRHPRRWPARLEGIDRCSRINDDGDQQIATHPRDDSVGIFRNSVALVWPLWLEGRCQASNVEVVAGDLFATPNPLTSHPEKNLLSPFSNIRAITPKLCTRSRLAIVEDHSP